MEIKTILLSLAVLAIAVYLIRWYVLFYYKVAFDARRESYFKKKFSTFIIDPEFAEITSPPSLKKIEAEQTLTQQVIDLNRRASYKFDRIASGWAAVDNHFRLFIKIASRRDINVFKLLKDCPYSELLATHRARYNYYLTYCKWVGCVHGHKFSNPVLNHYGFALSEELSKRYPKILKANFISPAPYLPFHSSLNNYRIIDPATAKYSNNVELLEGEYAFEMSNFIVRNIGKIKIKD